MATVLCTDLSLNYTNAPSTTEEPEYRWVGWKRQKSYIGYNNTGYIYTTVFRFTTPDFSSDVIPSHITVNLCLSQGNKSANFNWALSTSDSLKDEYFKTGSVTTDTYQICSGNYTAYDLTISGGIYPVNMYSDKLKPNTVYYAYFWPSTATHGFAQQYGILTTAGQKTTVDITYNMGYTITYNANGGTGAPESQVKVEGTDIALSSTVPTKKGSTSSSTFTITGSANGADVDDVSITATKTVVTTYTFKGWSTSPNGNIEYNAGDTYSVDANLQLYAIWKVDTSTSYSNNTISNLEVMPNFSKQNSRYTITYDVQGGSSESDDYGYKITDYTFLGWGSSKTSTDVLSDNTEYNAESTVYAIWEKTITYRNVYLPVPTRDDFSGNYIITLEPNGGSVDSTELISSTDTAYTFLGWGTTKNATSYVSNPYKPTKNITLYAIWKAEGTTSSVELPTPTRESSGEGITYTVTLNAPELDIDGTTLTATTASNYTFLGWANTPDGTEFVNSPFTPVNDITLYAIWQSDTSNGTVTLPTPDMEDGISNDTITLDAKGGLIETEDGQLEIVKYTIKRRYTRTFKGWSTSNTSENFVSINYAPTSNITLYYFYNSEEQVESIDLPTPVKLDTEEDSYIITLDPNGGSVNNTELISTKTVSYVFIGWYYASYVLGSLTEIPCDSPYTKYSITYGGNLYAKWRAVYSKPVVKLPEATRDFDLDMYSVTLDPNGGVTNIEELVTSKSTSYTFAGWSTSTDRSDMVANTYNPTQDTTLYAIWDNSIIGPDIVYLPIPIKGGYVFIGWGESVDSTEFVNNRYIPEESCTLYAIYDIGDLINMGDLFGQIYVWNNGLWKLTTPKIYNDGSFKTYL